VFAIQILTLFIPFFLSSFLPFFLSFFLSHLPRFHLPAQVFMVNGTASPLILDPMPAGVAFTFVVQAANIHGFSR
jgi:hypothetical protein